MSYPDKDEFTITGEAINIARADSYIGDSIIKISGWNVKVGDKYHTIDELYDHRAALFAAFCNFAYEELFDEKDPETWMPFVFKSKLHSDQTMFEGGYFIAGLRTPKGYVTYHMKIDKWWDRFRVPEVLTAPEWDGHTPNDCIERLLSI